MATVQQLLDDINLRYRNSFSTEQKLVWMNDEQRELFEIIQADSVPYAFDTVEGFELYPIPDEIDINRIKTMTIQVNDASPPQFQELRYLRNDDEVQAWGYGYWYTIIERNFFIHIPGGAVDGRKVYIYLDQIPEEITLGSLAMEPSVPVQYQEILKLGVLKRIAQARKDVIMANNYESERQEKIADMEWRMKLKEPEFDAVLDVMPRVGRRWSYGTVGRYIRP